MPPSLFHGGRTLVFCPELRRRVGGPPIRPRRPLTCYLLLCGVPAAGHSPVFARARSRLCLPPLAPQLSRCAPPDAPLHTHACLAPSRRFLQKRRTPPCPESNIPSAYLWLPGPRSARASLAAPTPAGRSHPLGEPPSSAPAQSGGCLPVRPPWVRGPEPPRTDPFIVGSPGPGMRRARCRLSEAASRRLPRNGASPRPPLRRSPFVGFPRAWVGRALAPASSRCLLPFRICPCIFPPGVCGRKQPRARIHVRNCIGLHSASPCHSCPIGWCLEHHVLAEPDPTPPPSHAPPSRHDRKGAPPPLPLAPPNPAGSSRPRVLLAAGGAAAATPRSRHPPGRWVYVQPATACAPPPP